MQYLYNTYKYYTGNSFKHEQYNDDVKYTTFTVFSNRVQVLCLNVYSALNVHK